MVTTKTSLISIKICLWSWDDVTMICVVLVECLHSPRHRLLLLSLHHAARQEEVVVKEGSVLVVHVGLEPGLISILVEDCSSAQETTDCVGYAHCLIDIKSILL